jgi:hypothetical protein
MSREHNNILFRARPVKQMSAIRARLLVGFLSLCVSGSWILVNAQRSADDEFGPVVRAYLGYLRNEQEVVDDRVSRREITPAYYRRNSNRIKALRQMALKLARESNNDYLPELEAVTPGEMRLLFENPPAPSSLKVGEVIKKTFQYLGSVRSIETFYVFARLNPYEQGDLTGDGADRKQPSTPESSASKSVSRSRRVTPQAKNP